MTATDPLVETLQTAFGLHEFREGQRAIIEAILEGRDVIAVMPTGGGKSLCYQLPALLLPGLTLVISPLIALMKDQVEALQARRLPATYINSTLDVPEQQRRLAQAASGQVRLLYVAPERFRSPQFVRAISGMDTSLFAVDEAHCLSQWGHDFRPDYLKLARAIAAVGRPPVAAFTATATREVRADIARTLQMDDPVTFFAGVDRPNLRLAFQYLPSRGAKDKKLQAVAETVREHGEETGIVYASTRKHVQRIHEHLEAVGLASLPYHAGLDDASRNRAQDAFMQGEIQAIVATNAFGMGVDKPDIRYVIHFDIPGSLEAYYQEIGRAGRDGRPALCQTLFCYSDRYIQEFFHQGSNPPRDTVEAVHRVLCEAQQDETSVALTAAQIKQRIPDGPSEMAVSTSLKILERAGVIARGYRGEGPATVKLLRPRDELLTRLSKAPVQYAVVSALPAIAEGDLRCGARVDLGALAYEAGVGRQHVSRVLSELKRAGHIDYDPPFRGRRTRVIIQDPDLPVDWATLEEKARRDLLKIDTMIAFARTEACRKWFLRKYFMGEGGATFCGVCDRCAGRSQADADEAAASAMRRWQGLEALSGADPESGTETHRIDPAGREGSSPASAGGRGVAATTHPEGDRPLEGDALLLVRKALSCVARMNGRFGRQRVAQVLKGSSDKEILRWQLNRLSTYGLLADLRIDDIVGVLDALLNAGLLAATTVDRAATHRVTVIELTPRGRDVMLGKATATLALPEPVLPAHRDSERRAARSRGVSRGAAAPDEPPARPSLAGAFSVPGRTPPLSSTPRRTQDSEEADAGDPSADPLYAAIVAWRAERAAELKVPPYIILHNHTVREIARVRPRSLEALERIRGMGPKRCATHGPVLLRIIERHVS